MKRILLSIVLVWILFSSVVYAAGSAYTITWKERNLRFVSIAWTVDASGALSGEGSVVIPGGRLLGFIHDPESGVTDAYDLTITASFPIALSATPTTRTVDVADILNGQGANLSNSENGGYVQLTASTAISSCTLSPVIAAAGNATSGNIVLVFLEE